MTVAKYRKKPGEVEAVHYTGDNLDEVRTFLGEAARAERVMLPGPGRGVHEGILIRTLEGDMRASVGDWIIRDVKGALQHCGSDVFAATYEPFEQDGDDR